MLSVSGWSLLSLVHKHTLIIVENVKKNLLILTGTANCAEHTSREAKVDDRIFNLITQVLDLFKKLDANGDGSISPLEVLGFLTSQAAPGVNLPTIPSITDLLKPFDTNNDGNIDLAGKCSLQIQYS